MLAEDDPKHLDKLIDFDPFQVFDIQQRRCCLDPLVGKPDRRRQKVECLDHCDAFCDHLIEARSVVVSICRLTFLSSLRGSSLQVSCVDRLSQHFRASHLRELMFRTTQTKPPSAIRSERLRDHSKTQNTKKYRFSSVVELVQATHLVCG